LLIINFRLNDFVSIFTGFLIECMRKIWHWRWVIYFY